MNAFSFKTRDLCPEKRYGYDSLGRNELVCYDVQDHAHIEVFWKVVKMGGGPCASLIVFDEEILRFDCFGFEAGHFHTNLRQPTLLGRQSQNRLFFFEQTVEEQVERAAFEIGTNANYYLQRNRSPKIRRVVLRTERLQAAAELMRAKMLEFQRFVPALNTREHLRIA